MQKTYLYNDPSLKQFRRDLRNNATKAEQHLWRLLRRSELGGRKFRRQQSIGKYVVDFFCYSESLAVELDGDIHLEERVIKHDKRRDAFLRKNKVKVLRIKNEELFDDEDMVLMKIKQQFTTP